MGLVFTGGDIHVWSALHSSEASNSVKSANVKKEIREKTKKGWILMWSDAFLRCFIKQKENSVWIITATVCPPTNEMSSGFYTHVLAMGKSGSDHTKVINHYLREIKQLQTGVNTFS